MEKPLLDCIGHSEFKIGCCSVNGCFDITYSVSYNWAQYWKTIFPTDGTVYFG